MGQVIEGGLRTDDAPTRLRSEGDEDIHIQRGKRFRTARPSSLTPEDLERRIISTAMALRTEQLPANRLAGIHEGTPEGIERRQTDPTIGPARQ